MLPINGVTNQKILFGQYYTLLFHPRETSLIGSQFDASPLCGCLVSSHLCPEEFIIFCAVWAGTLGHARHYMHTHTHRFHYLEKLMNEHIWE